MLCLQGRPIAAGSEILAAWGGRSCLDQTLSKGALHEVAIAAQHARMMDAHAAVKQLCHLRTRSHGAQRIN